MNRFVKYQSNEAGNFTATRNLITFNIPPADYNFKESYIELDVAVDGETYADPEHAGCVCIFKTAGRDDDIRCPRNEALIRRVRLSTQDANLEDIDRVDVLRQTLGLYTTDPVERLGESYKSISQPPQFGQISTPFRDVYNLGGESQTARAVDLKAQISLKDLIELGKETEMPISQMGTCKLEIYIEPDNMALAPTANNIVGPLGTNHPAPVLTTEAHTAGGGDGPTTTTLTIADKNANAVDIFDHWGLYVGQAVDCALAAGAGASAVARAHNKIKTLTRDGNNIIVEFEFNVFTALNDGEAAALEISVAAPNVLPQVTIKSASIVLSEYTTPLPKVDEIRYSTFTTELISTQQGNLHKQTLLEPNAFNIFLCGANEPPFSTFTHLASYRLSVNNVPIINRDAEASATLRNGEHWELIGRALKNGGMPWNNILEADLNVNATQETPAGALVLNWPAGNAAGVKMIAAPVPISSQMKPLLLELNGDGDPLGNLQLYKQVVRSVKL